MSGRIRSEKRFLVWDLPARISHWGFALSTSATLFLAWEYPPSSTPFKYHMLAALFAGWFLCVRIFLAFFGSQPLRWRGLLHTPRQTLSYFRNVILWRKVEHVGLNPGSAVFAICFYLTLAAAIWTGFLPDWVETWHGRLGWGLFWLIGLHLAGLLLHALRHRALTPLAMLNGMAAGVEGRGPASMNARAGIALLLLSGIVAWLLVRNFDEASATVTVPFYGEISLPVTERG